MGVAFAYATLLFIVMARFITQGEGKVKALGLIRSLAFLSRNLEPNHVIV
jgi:hypothetical protein